MPRDIRMHERALVIKCRFVYFYEGVKESGTKGSKNVISKLDKFTICVDRLYKTNMENY